MGTKRTKPTSRKDSLGRTIKEAENSGEPATSVSPDASRVSASGDFVEAGGHTGSAEDFARHPAVREQINEFASTITHNDKVRGEVADSLEGLAAKIGQIIDDEYTEGSVVNLEG